MLENSKVQQICEKVVKQRKYFEISNRKKSSIENSKNQKLEKQKFQNFH